MNTNHHPASPRAMLGALYRDMSLIWQLTKRDIIARYRGSFLGILWSFVNPLLMLTIYSFVFTIVFKAQWTRNTGVKGEYAVILFAGLAVHAFLAECISRAPLVILNNPNFVKKVVFPLEILVPTAIGSALFQFMISIFVLLLAYLLVHHSLQWTILLMPLIMAPFILLVLGISWFLAALGVYLRDIPQVIGVLITVLLFTSPVLYPVTSLPVATQAFIYLNPLSFIVEQFRNVMLWGEMPHWAGLGLYTAMSMLICWCGFFWFQKTRKGFADVL
jgi:lipopolysaccharide transport system permease protein